VVVNTVADMTFASRSTIALAVTVAVALTACAGAPAGPDATGVGAQAPSIATPTVAPTVDTADAVDAADDPFDPGADPDIPPDSPGPMPPGSFLVVTDSLEPTDQELSALPAELFVDNEHGAIVAVVEIIVHIQDEHVWYSDGTRAHLEPGSTNVFTMGLEYADGRWRVSGVATAPR
jgi:hypothetical protein